MSGFAGAIGWFGSLLAIALFGSPVAAAPPGGASPDPQRLEHSAEMAVPDALKPWIPWVLEQTPGEPDRRGCHLDAQGARALCAWPGPLTLELNGRGGRFDQVWELLAEDWVPLPGDADAWPQEVQVGDRPLAVVPRHGRPSVKLAPGVHALSGRFDWRQRPESLVLPPEIGLMRLVLDGRPQPAPRLDEGGRLWLRDPGATDAGGEGDRMRLEVYRRIEDSLPLQVLTRLELDVSGRGREARLGPVPLANGIPLSVASPLPTRLERDGTLRVQVRPGRWVLEVRSYHPGAVSQLTRTHPGEPWPAREIWAFAARPELRQVEVSGAQRLDPQQIGLPEDWASLPVYSIGPDDTLQLMQRRRGDPDPEPDRLRLSRELWLDFDGQGFSARDRLGGELTRGWRLETGAGLELGRVEVDGEPVSITRLSPTAAPGVEVRRGRLNLLADGRLATSPERIPASGWALALDGAETRLNLPPGWDLLAVSGVDNLPDTWLNRWTLLDLFLVLVLTLGIGRIWGPGWGALALLALTLTWQSPDAPRQVWLHLLVATALLRLLPATPVRPGLDSVRWLLLWYRRLGLLTLLVIGLPFLATEIRDALYPQLARPHWSLTPGQAPGGAMMAPMANLAEPPDRGMSLADEASPARDMSASLKRSVAPAPVPAPPPLERLDPNALVQTGAGIPNWSWRQIELAWTGPVGAEARARLWLLPPAWTLGLSLSGALLLALLGLRFAGARKPPGAARGAPMLVLALCIAGGLSPAPALASAFPSPELLNALRARLLAPPDCLPDCVTLARLGLRAEPGHLSLDLTLDAAADVAAGVLGGQAGWSPTEVSLDGAVFDRLRRGADGGLLVPLAPGRHQLRMTGPLADADSIDLPLALRPLQVAVETSGWRVEGLDAAGRAGHQIQLIRLAQTASENDRPLTQDALPPLLQVERRLALGLDWRVETVARRLSAPEFPLLVPVPLLPGESVQTPSVQVEQGQVKVALLPAQTQVRWTSSLEPSALLELIASTDARLAEAWSLDLGAMWHLDWEGVPLVHHRASEDAWLPSWRPLPGERLRLRITRPEGVPGPTLTLDQVAYEVEPGRRGSDFLLILQARSSRGGVHEIRLPEGAEPRHLSLDGQSLPLPSLGDVIELPLVPGRQEMRLAWRSPQTLGASFSPAVPDLGLPVVNLTQRLRLPDDRWVLFATGPGIGPAVLFWGLLLLWVGLSLGLGRNALTPLRVHDWLLLGIGLALAEVWVVLLVGGWLFALGWRQGWTGDGLRPWRFNLVQLGLALLTLAALTALIAALQQGLLGRPEMWIMGNGSSATLLNWYQDRGGPRLPEVWVLSVPMWIYRALMLAWALWLALRLLDWLRWGWEGFARPQPWRERLKRESGPARLGE